MSITPAAFLSFYAALAESAQHTLVTKHVVAHSCLLAPTAPFAKNTFEAFTQCTGDDMHNLTPEQIISLSVSILQRTLISAIPAHSARQLHIAPDKSARKQQIRLAMNFPGTRTGLQQYSTRYCEPTSMAHIPHVIWRLLRHLEVLRRAQPPPARQQEARPLCRPPTVLSAPQLALQQPARQYHNAVV